MTWDRLPICAMCLCTVAGVEVERNHAAHVTRYRVVCHGREQAFDVTDAEVIGARSIVMGRAFTGAPRPMLATLDEHGSPTLLADPQGPKPSGPKPSADAFRLAFRLAKIAGLA